MYGTLPVIKRLLNPRATGTIAGAIFIGTSGSAQCGTTFAYDSIRDAGTFIDGMLYARYKTPFTTVPEEIKFIANRLAAAYIIQACKLYTADSASNFLFDKQQIYYQHAMTKLQALADGVEIIRGEKITSVPQAEFDTTQKREFAVPGSSNVRPAVGL